MICPKCGENNSANFRFCGMCGTSLEPRRPAGAPRTAGGSDASRTFPNEAVESRVPAQAAAAVARGSQPGIASSGTSGPSFLGLNQPFREGNGSNSTGGTSPDESFSGLDSFFEQDEPGVSARGIIVMVVLLVALGFAGWWAYTQYNGPSASGARPQTTAQTPGTQPSGTETAGDNSVSNPKPPEAASPASASSSPSPSPNANSSQSAAVPPAESRNSTPAPVVEPAVTPKSDRSSPLPPKAAERTRSHEPSQAAHGQKIARADTKPAARPSATVPVSGDRGDAEFKRGEAYLYGRGMPENCDLAIRNLKEASAKQNAKARSAFGTMYATGHCVPRDLPTSYSWFAQALRADPNNQILEKDLTAVWNQMTPPERQMAAKNKQ